MANEKGSSFIFSGLPIKSKIKNSKSVVNSRRVGSLREVHMSDRFPARLNVEEFSTLNRRAFLRGLGASALITATGCLFSRSVWGSPVFAAYPFALGVASGEPAPDGFVIWTKIAPKPLERGGGMPKKPVEVEWMVATDERMRQVVEGRGGRTSRARSFGARRD